MPELKQPKPLVVIGAGVIGLVTALRLQQNGHAVLLLDPAGVGQGCSYGNAGHFATEQVLPLADPALLWQLPRMLLDPYGPLAIRPAYLTQAIPFFLKFIAQMQANKRQANTQALKLLTQSAIGAWQQLLGQDGSHLIQQRGSLLSFEPASSAVAAKVAAVYQQQQVPLQLLSKAEVHELQPGIGASVARAIFFSAVGHTSDPAALNHWLYTQFCQAGGRFLPAKVLKIIPGIRLSLDTTVGQLYASQVILTAGVASTGLLADLGCMLPMEAEGGYHLMTAPPKTPMLPIASYDRKMILTPMQHGLRLAGTVEFAGTQAPANWQRALRLRQHAEILWPALQHSATGPERCWYGLRPTLPDSLPIVSNCRIPGLWLHFGHQHLGLTLAASSTEYLLGLMSGVISGVNNPFSVQRFARHFGSINVAAPT